MSDSTLDEKVYWHPDTDLDPGVEQTLPHTVQVLIVGGGYTGLSAALYLAQNGVQVAVVDREAGPGYGASGRNAGMVLSGYPLDCSSLLGRFGTKRAKALFSASLEAVELVASLIKQGGIACDFQSTEHITAAVRSGHREWLHREQESMAQVSGRIPRLLDSKQMREELGTGVYWGGLADPWAASLNPARYAAGLSSLAKAAGAAVFWDTAVEHIPQDRSNIQVQTRRGKIRAEKILVAANGLMHGLDSWLKRRVAPVESVITATHKVPPQVMDSVLPGNKIVSDTKRVLHYFRRSPDGTRLLFGGRPPLLRGSLPKRAMALYTDMRAVFPQLQPYRPRWVWSGNVGFTRDHMPHAGKRDKLVYALGYCGHGIALATYLGRQAAKAVLEENLPDVPFPQASFPGFPTYGKRAWFIPPALAWFSLLDRLG